MGSVGSWTDHSAEVSNFCFRLNDAGSKFHFSSDKHACNVLFTDEALLPIRRRGQIWGKTYCLTVSKLQLYEALWSNLNLNCSSQIPKSIHLFFFSLQSSLICNYIIKPLLYSAPLPASPDCCSSALQMSNLLPGDRTLHKLASGQTKVWWGHKFWTFLYLIHVW